MKSFRLVLIFIVLIIVTLAVYQGWRAYAKRRSAGERKNAVPVEIMPVSAQDFDQTINLTGTVVAENQTDVPAKVPGKVIAYRFSEGAWVERGQTVVTIDRDEVGVEFKETTVEAPISGWLTKRYADTGTQVAPGMPLFQVADYRRVKLVVSVSESDISKVRAGSQAQVSMDAWPEEIFMGQVKQVSPTVDYLSRTVKAEISLGNQGLKLRPGMYGRAVIKVRRWPQVVVVPSAAILERDQGLQVFVVSGGRAWSRPVEVALDLGDRAVLKQGLRPGDSLIVAGQHSVDDSSAVEVVGGR